MTLADYFAVFRRRWPIVFLTALVAAVAVYLTTPAKARPIDRFYRATNTMVVSDPSAGAAQQIGTITFSQLPLFARTGEVPKRSAAILKYKGPPAQLASGVETAIDAATGTFTITYQDKSAKKAVATADTFADQIVGYLSERQDTVRTIRQARTQAKLDQLRAQIAEKEVAIKGVDSEIRKSERDALARVYSTTYEALQSLADVSGSGLQLTTLERAQPISIATGGFKAPTSRPLRVSIALAVGAFFGMGLAVLLERLDDKIRDRRRAEKVFGVPVIAEIPSLSRKEREHLVHLGPGTDNAIAEAYRTLRTSVSLLIEEESRQLGTIVITSSVPAEGKSTVAVNLAIAFAENGRRVVLANADFRRPSVASEVLPGGGPNVPIVDFSLAGTVPVAKLLQETRFSRLRLLDLSCYRSVPPGTLVRATKWALRRLPEGVDVVIVDTPPLSVTAEALEFVPEARVVLHMARLGETRAPAGHRAAELLRLRSEDVTTAVVLNDTRGASKFGHEYYGYRPEAGSTESRWRRKPGRDRHPAPFQETLNFDANPTEDDPFERRAVER